MKHLLSKEAEKFLAKIPAKDAKRLIAAIEKLPLGDVKKLHG